MPGHAVYMDYNATTPVAEAVAAEISETLRTTWGNPSSQHPLGKKARALVERARESVGRLIGASPEEIVFTSGGTESNNLAIHGVLNFLPRDRMEVITSSIEHPATSVPLSSLERKGIRIHRLPTLPSGTVDVDAFQSALGPQSTLVTIMHSNNETGVLQPIKTIGRLLENHPAHFHTDCAQSVGKVPIDVNALRVDLLSIAGHKLYAPKGVGALFVRAGTPLRPYMEGAGHENGLRPGTENVPYIAGLGIACDLANSRLEETTTRVCFLRDALQKGLTDEIPGCQVMGNAAERLPNTLNIVFPTHLGADLLAALPWLYASTGSACHSGEVSGSPVLQAMGLSAQESARAIRFSLGHDTTEAHIERVVREMKTLF